MPKLLVQNRKMLKTAKKRGVRLLNFGIPAGWDATRTVKTCPKMGACAEGCFAKQGAYMWTPVKSAYQWRFERTQDGDFARQMAEAIDKELNKRGATTKKLVIRIHDSGDFYDRAYLGQWLSVIRAYPQVRFYAYTKMVSMFKKFYDSTRNALPQNLTVIFSYGGAEDHLINPLTDRHSAVFSTAEELERQGYVNAMDDDLLATEHRKVGLVYHGAKSKQWLTKQRKN